MANLIQYSKSSAYGHVLWENAYELMRLGGFTEDETHAVLQAALKNRLNPQAFATKAVHLRDHVKKGLPL